VKNKKILIIIGVVVVLLLAGGGYYLLNSSNSPSTSQNSIPEPTVEVVPTISAKDIGLTLTMGSDGKRVVMAIGNAKDLSSIDYEVSYTSQGNIPRGAIGHVDVKDNSKPLKQEIILGTCSDVCHYDQGVSNIKLVVKVTKTDGKIYQAQVGLE